MAFTYEVVDVVTYEEKLYLEGHLIRRWFDGMAAELQTAISTEAPLNKRPNKHPGEPPVGSLKAGITADTDLTGPHSLEATIRSSAYYTMYVIGGTAPLIIARGAGGLFATKGASFSLPAQPWIKAMRTQKISGQEANDFMLRGYEIVASRHEALG